MCGLALLAFAQISAAQEGKKPTVRELLNQLSSVDTSQAAVKALIARGDEAKEEKPAEKATPAEDKADEKPAEEAAEDKADEAPAAETTGDEAPAAEESTDDAAEEPVEKTA